MRVTDLSGLLLAFGLLAAGCGDDGELDYQRSCPPGDATEQCQVFDIVNRERAQAGLVPYEWDAALAQAAQAHCEDMVANDYFDHVGLDGSSFDERAAAAGYQGRAVAENIAQGADSPEDVMSMWMGSEGHRANILSARANEIGVGYCEGGTVVQVFGAG